MNKEDNQQFQTIDNAIKIGYNHINNYFKILKDNCLNKILNQINELESSYEKIENKNIEILSLLERLISNDDSEEMKNNSLNTNTNI